MQMVSWYTVARTGRSEKEGWSKTEVIPILGQKIA